jgi:hypothetical protein
MNTTPATTNEEAFFVPQQQQEQQIVVLGRALWLARERTGKFFLLRARFFLASFCERRTIRG